MGEYLSMQILNRQSRRFARDMTFAILIVSVVVIAPVIYFSAQARRSISEQYINGATGAAVIKFRAMTDSTVSMLTLVRDLGVSSRTPMSDSEEMNRLFFPFLKRNEMLFGICVGNSNGGSYYLRREGEELITREIGEAGIADNTASRLWSTDGKMLKEETVTSDFDPRLRPWFTPALASQGVFWTDPYKFFTGGNVGVTASVALTNSNADTPVVVAFDMQLDDLYVDMQSQAPSENSKIYIFRRNASRYVPKMRETESGFIPVDDSPEDLISKAHSLWKRASGSSLDALKFRHENRTWWCGFESLDNVKHDTWIAVLVPERDITGDVSRRRKKLMLAGLGVIIFCGGVLFWIVRRYGRSTLSQDEPYDPNDLEGSVRRIIARGEGRTIEFKATMRMNLHTKKPGKEIEVAWVKAVAAFLNTGGGTLLTGVTDAGEISGLEADVFENQDRCQLHFKNIIAAHLGAERSKYIRFNIVIVDEKQVGVIRCEASKEPVFMKHPKGEGFFIRNGPSSDELPVSEALEYIKHRRR